MLSLLWGALWCVRYASSRALHNVAGMVFYLLPIGILVDWFSRPVKNFDFPAYVERMRVAAPGTTLSTPVLPGPPWIMTLTKKGP
jgi:hypothetical protein